jgi:hypothetical protein
MANLTQEHKIFIAATWANNRFKGGAYKDEIYRALCVEGTFTKGDLCPVTTTLDEKWTQERFDTVLAELESMGRIQWERGRIFVT